MKNRIDHALNNSFGDLQVDMENLLENIFGGKAKSSCSSSKCQWVPLTDVRESETGYEIEVELPGFGVEDVNVEIKEGRLEISGERAKQEVAEGTRVLRTERATGKFQRSFEFSTSVDAEKISAEFKNGILALSVPKSEKELARKIEIQVAE